MTGRGLCAVPLTMAMITANARKVCPLAHERKVVTYAKAPMRRGSLDALPIQTEPYRKWGAWGIGVVLKRV